MRNTPAIDGFENRCNISMLRTILLGALCLMALAAHAQYRASIQGVVSDPTGAVVAGANVTLTDTATNQKLTTVTSSSGVYTFNALPPSVFTLAVDKAGFKKKALNDVHIVPEQANALNVQLELGDAAQTVTVDASNSTLLETQTASVSGTISSNQIQHMPSFGRDVFQLAELTPGVFGDGSQAAGGGTSNLPATYIGGTGAADGIFKTENGPQIIANGAQNTANGITIDGISTASTVWGGTTVVTPSEDSIADVKVVSNSYDAETGRFMGAQMQVTTKSGTNTVHGSLFFKADRPGLNAYQSYNGPNSVGPGTAAERGLLRDQSRFNQFGGSVGGPIWKNKIFAFFNYETLRNNTSVTASEWYDTSEFDGSAPANSIASQFLTFPGAGVNASGQIAASCVNAGLTEGVNCATIPGKGLDIGSPLKSPLGTQDLTYVSSGQPGVGSGLDGIADIGEYTTLNPSVVKNTQYNGRLDANVTSRDRLTYTMYWVPGFNSSYSGPVRPYNISYLNTINDAFAGLWNHTFSPTLINEARVNAAGWRWNQIADNPQSPFGLPQDNISQIGALGPYNPTPATTFNFFGVPGPTVFNQWTYGYQDVATKSAGRHNIKFGGGVTRLYYLNEAPYNSRPTYTFYNVWDFLNDAPEAETGVFNPLTGTPTIHRQDNRQDIWGFFVQDDFKIKPNLTLNLGIRYSYFGSYTSKDGNLSTLELGSGASTFSGMQLRVGGNLYNAQKSNFGPEFGFAWSPTLYQGKVVVRGGFGLNFTGEEFAVLANGGTNPPLVIQPNFSSVSPTQINPSILYEVANNIHSLIDYPPNPATIVTFGANNLPTTGETSVTGFPYPNLNTPYSYHYSLDTQYEIGQNWVATMGYQGSMGRHLSLQFNANVLGAAEGIALNPAVNSVDLYSNEGQSNYNALLTDLRHQFSKGFSLEAQYTWSKSMDDGSQPQYQTNYPYLPRFGSWGRSDYNIANAFKIFGLWQPVIFHGANNWLEKLAGGWSLSGIFNDHTGFPWTPIYTNIAGGSLYYQGSNNNQLRPAAYLGGAGRNTSNGAFKSGPGGANQSSFNQNYPNGALSYFTIPTYTPVTAPFPATFAAPELPGVARNALNGPNYRDVDASLTKSFGIPKVPVLGENAKIEFRVDAFNLFNNVNLTNVSTNITSGGSDTSNPSFGQAQSALGSRTLDIQARFSF